MAFGAVLVGPLHVLLAVTDSTYVLCLLLSHALLLQRADAVGLDVMLVMWSHTQRGHSVASSGGSADSPAMGQRFTCSSSSVECACFLSHEALVNCVVVVQMHHWWPLLSVLCIVCAVAAETDGSVNCCFLVPGRGL